MKTDMDPFPTYDLIIMAIFRWKGPYSSTSIALSKAFSKSNRVFYINHPYTWRDYYGLLKAPEYRQLRNQLKKGQPIYEKEATLSENFTSVIPPLMLPINFLPKGRLYNSLASRNNKKVTNTIRKTIVDHNIQQYIFINCFDPFYVPVLPADLRPALNIYYCVDDISQSEYLADHGTYLEREAIRRADLTLTTSSELYRMQSAFAKKIALLPNAADVNHFRQAAERDLPQPNELADLPPGPIIGFVGNLDEQRIDYSLLKKTALAHPDKQWVLIGPLNNSTYKTIGLDRLPNVHFTGKVDMALLPQYLRYFDCAIIPFACNALTASIYPLKINEYLAAGKAVVSTAFSADIKQFKDHIFLAKSEEEFIAAIDQAIVANGEADIRNRLAEATKNSWDARVAAFWQLIKGELNTGSPPAPVHPSFRNHPRPQTK